MKKLVVLFVLLMPALTRAAEKRILVYTRNFVSAGKGYVHDNIQAGVDAIKKMGAENGFAVDAADDPKLFMASNLKQYKVIVFSNSNNEAFENDTQRDAFKAYIQAGGGFVGIHSASGSERQWPYFWSVLGSKFNRHPKLQPISITVKDREHPATRHLPATFEWPDECYYFHNLNPDIHVLLAADPSKLVDPKQASDPPDRIGDTMPLAWCHTFDGGREFYTALGHKKEDYANPILYKHILGGILWAMGAK